MKLWTIKSNECVATLDQHTEKIWSLASSADGEVLVSGGADSMVCFWKVQRAIFLSKLQKKFAHKIFNFD